jgi:hypothetical protein
MALAAGTGTEHRYQTCTDEFCDRFPCRVYKEGFRNGQADEGAQARAYAQGRADGFQIGVAACPRPHTGTGW